MSKAIALIVAGGSGLRAESKTPKQYLHLDSKTIIEHTFDKFNNHPSIDKIVFVIAKNHENLFNNIFNNKIDYCFGGDSRQDSVRLGLAYIRKYNPDLVLVHDAARPFIDNENITKIISELKTNEAVTLTSKINDTIKYKDGEFAGKTLNRDLLCSIETPQAFKYETLLHLHEKYQHENLTDDTSLFEKDNMSVKLLFNDKINFKITTAKDVKLARLMVKEKYD